MIDSHAVVKKIQSVDPSPSFSNNILQTIVQYLNQDIGIAKSIYKIVPLQGSLLLPFRATLTFPSILTPGNY